jgi:20S proteasome subunit beta 7
MDFMSNSASMFSGTKCPPLWANGPDVQSYHNFPNKPAFNGPRTVTQSPVTTGSSLLAMKYEGGVMMAADTLGSYGSMARFPDLNRILKVNSTTVLGAGGDFADFQFISDVIKQKQIDEDCKDDGFNLKPKALHSWLTRVLYNRRSKFDPLWNNFLVIGMQDSEPYLGFVDLKGVAFTETVLATGMGIDLCIPVMRAAMEKKGGLLSHDEARQTLLQCVRLAYLRDCRSWPKFHLANVDATGATLEGPLMIDSDWSFAKGVAGYE